MGSDRSRGCINSARLTSLYRRGVTVTAPAHPWLESDDEFEGVGAHRDNPRYDPVDEDGFDDVTGLPIPGWVKPDATP